jgi:hypothetical protein
LLNDNGIRERFLLDLLETTAEETPLKVEKIKLENQPTLLEEKWDGAPASKRRPQLRA